MHVKLSTKRAIETCYCLVPVKNGSCSNLRCEMVSKLGEWQIYFFQTSASEVVGMVEW